MKKIKNRLITKSLIIAFFVLFACINVVCAQTAEKNLEKVNIIGHKILETNKLPTQIEFKVALEDHVNAYANINKEVYIYNGLLNLVETDDELAGVIAHEIGHIVNSHIQKQTFLSMLISPITKVISSISKKLWVSKIVDSIGTLSMLKVSRKAEYEADLTGADLMINAGYDPLGMVSVLNKVTENHLDIISTHPSGDKRLVYLYDYLSFNYSSQSLNDYNTDSYKEFQGYMDSILKDRQSNPKKMIEYFEKQDKLKEERIKRAERLKNSTNPWEVSFNILQTTMQVIESK